MDYKSLFQEKEFSSKKLVNGQEIDNYKSDCPFDCFYYCYKMNLEKVIMWLSDKLYAICDNEDELIIEDLEEDNTVYILLNDETTLLVEYIGTKVYLYYRENHLVMTIIICFCCCK